MAAFGFMVLHVLTAEQRTQLDELLATFGAPPSSTGTFPMPEPPVAYVPSSNLQGYATRGAVTIRWESGVPVRAQLDANANRWADVPPAFWQAVTQYAPRELWEPFTYLAFLESDYRADAHNGSGEDSWGVLQVNRNAWPQYSVAELSTYSGNIVAAVAIYNAQGVGAWFNSARLLGLI